MSRNRLRLTDIWKRFETPHHVVEVLRGISFEAEPGESLSVTGPSGSGKSTLLHIIGALEAPSSGEIRLGHSTPHTMPEPELAAYRNRQVGFVFQDHHLLPQYSVLHNVILPTAAAPHGESSLEAADRARELLRAVGLGERLEHRPAELSGGERQRVAIARALINRPDLLLCDEPTGNLDSTTASSVADLLFALHSDERNILIIVTHSPKLAARCGRRFELRDGQCSTV